MTREETIKVLQSIEDRAVDFPYMTACDWVAIAAAKRHLTNSIEVKEADLENSMVCKVDWYDGFLLDYTQKQQDDLLKKIGANVGDKIRVILIKE